MKLLLDTNAFLLQIGILKNRNMSIKTKRLLEKAEVVYVSAVTVVELHIKTMIGKLEVPDDLEAAIVRAGDVPLAYNVHAADAVLSLTALAHHDPFDRMLLSQAQTEGLTFVTTDQTLVKLGLPFVVDATE